MSDRDNLVKEIVATGRLIVANKEKPEQQRHYVTVMKKLIEMLDGEGGGGVGRPTPNLNQDAAVQDEGGNLHSGKKKYIKDTGGVK